jgi:hypothetical protein
VREKELTRPEATDEKKKEPMMPVKAERKEQALVFPEVKKAAAEKVIISPRRKNDDSLFSSVWKTFKMKKPEEFSFDETKIFTLKDEGTNLNDSVQSLEIAPFEKKGEVYLKEEIKPNSEGQINPKRELERQYEALKNLSALKQRFKVCSLIGSGNCLFESLLTSYAIDVKYHELLRQYTCDLIEMTDSSVAQSVFSTMNMTKKRYVEIMRGNGEWGTNLEIAICTHWRT